VSGFVPQPTLRFSTKKTKSMSFNPAFTIFSATTPGLCFAEAGCFHTKIPLTIDFFGKPMYNATGDGIPASL
jgi:hypothetical protein